MEVDTKGHSIAWKGGTLTERKNMYALANNICSQEHLSAQLTHDLLLTVAGESGFNQWCVNTDTHDYGIAQFSALYYLKEYNMTPQQAIDNPEQCLRIMAKNFKAGRQSNWVAYQYRTQHVNQIIELSKPDNLEQTRTNIQNAQSVVPEVVATNTPTLLDGHPNIFKLIILFILAYIPWLNRK